MKDEQIRCAIIHRVLCGIQRAAARQESGAALKTYGLLGRLEYAHYGSGVCYDLDACVARLALAPSKEAA
jgi:hypothetical protein